MKYLSYGTKKAVPQRMARKQLRKKVFITNKKLNKLAKKLRRQQARQSALEASEEQSD